MRTAKADARFAFNVHPVIHLPAGILNPAPYNAKAFSARKLEGLKMAILEHGFVDPMVVQKHSPKHGPNVIIGGHQRLRAAREISTEKFLPVPDLPCIVLDVEDRTAKRLNIALNKLGMDFDAQLLGKLLEDIHSTERITTEEVIMLGFEEEEFSKFIHLSDPPVITPAVDEGFGQSVTLSLEFHDTRMRNAVKATLKKKVELTKKTTGEIIFGLLEGGKKKK